MHKTIARNNRKHEQAKSTNHRYDFLNHKKTDLKNKIYKVHIQHTLHETRHDRRGSKKII